MYARLLQQYMNVSLIFDMFACGSADLRLSIRAVHVRLRVCVYVVCTSAFVCDYLCVFSVYDICVCVCTCAHKCVVCVHEREILKGRIVVLLTCYWTADSTPAAVARIDGF